MKLKFHLLIVAFLMLGAYRSIAQTKSALDQAAQEVCNDLKDLDPEKATAEQIKSKFQSVMLKVFADHMHELMAEMNMENMNGENGRKIGEEIGRRMLKVCPSYVMLAGKMSEGSSSDDGEVSSTQGVISRINNTGDFVQMFVKDSSGRETNYYWLKYFKGSESFENAAPANIGKKIKIHWDEVEFYIPKAKGYYKLKEIKSIEFL
jgi:hypothetical protein